MRKRHEKVHKLRNVVGCNEASILFYFIFKLFKSDDYVFYQMCIGLDIVVRVQLCELCHTSL